jgi:hypothetical protein
MISLRRGNKGGHSALFRGNKTGHRSLFARKSAMSNIFVKETSLVHILLYCNDFRMSARQSVVPEAAIFPRSN